MAQIPHKLGTQAYWRFRLELLHTAAYDVWLRECH